MRRDYIEDQQIVERYLQDRLSAEEEAEFEECFLANPELLDELEFADKLRQGLQDVATVASPAKPAQPKRRFPSFFQTPQYAMAATVFLLVSMTVTSVLYQRVDRLSAAGQASSFASTRIIPVLSVRGGASGETANRINVAAGEQIVLLVDPGPDVYSHYRTTIDKRDPASTGTPVWQRDRVMPGYQDMLALAIPGDRLETGDYRIRIEGWQAEWPADRVYEYVTELPLRIETGK